VPRPSGSPVSLRSGCCRLGFDWSGDRWSHAFTLEGDTGPVLWQSVDHDSDGPTAWPPSPAILEVWKGSEEAVLGVGRAGRSHFSLSATVDPFVPDAVRLEWACRLNGPPGRLGSTYAGPLNARVVIVPRAVAIEQSSVLPATILWSYRVSPQGIESLEPRGGGF
jgi:hypothetical protein